jgi:elongation factor 1-beta
LIAKTSVLLDVKPWDDETPMEKLRECVKSIQQDGLIWGADKFVPVGYGINKLQVRVYLWSGYDHFMEYLFQLL